MVDNLTEVRVGLYFPADEKLSGRSVLCIGARDGGEVRALRAKGAFAIGVDLQPLPHAVDLVLTGNALKLQFAPESVDYAFTNVMDHIPQMPVFVSEVASVLKPGGAFIAGVSRQLKSQDAWAVRDTGTPAFYQELADAMGGTGVMQRAYQRHVKIHPPGMPGMALDVIKWTKRHGQHVAAGDRVGFSRELAEPGASSSSEISFPAWNASNVRRVHPREYSEELLVRYKAEHQKMHQRIQASGGQGAAHQLLSALDGVGVRMDEVGLDATKLKCERYSLNPEGRRILETLLARTLDYVSFTTDPFIAPIMWKYDHPLRTREQCKSVQRKERAGAGHASLQQHLREHGYVSIADLGLNLLQLQQEAKRALAAANITTRRFQAANSEIPALASLLRNESIARIIRQYLGGAARFDGHVLLHIGQGLREEDYFSSAWHHDRCGRRLKLFVFLHDVREDGSPTQIADRTHNYFYYAYNGNSIAHRGLTRFSDSWVRARHKIVSMVGPAGGGFLFDTNAIHRGALGGLQSRTTLVLEFHALGKIPALYNAFPGASRSVGPCPSVKKPRGAISSWRRGSNGYPLYSVDAI